MAESFRRFSCGSRPIQRFVMAMILTHQRAPKIPHFNFLVIPKSMSKLITNIRSDFLSEITTDSCQSSFGNESLEFDYHIIMVSLSLLHHHANKNLYAMLEAKQKFRSCKRHGFL